MIFLPPRLPHTTSDEPFNFGTMSSKICFLDIEKQDILKKSRTYLTMFTSCSVTHKNMVSDPVVINSAPEENIILQWLKTNSNASPWVLLKSSQTSKPSRLVQKQTVVSKSENLTLITPDKELCAKEKWTPQKTEMLYAEGKVLEATEPDLSEAHGMMVEKYHINDNEFLMETVAEHGKGDVAARAAELLGELNSFLDSSWKDYKKQL
jgi:hypothetical protein